MKRKINARKSRPPRREQVLLRFCCDLHLILRADIWSTTWLRMLISSTTVSFHASEGRKSTNRFTRKKSEAAYNMKMGERITHRKNSVRICHKLHEYIQEEDAPNVQEKAAADINWRRNATPRMRPKYEQLHVRTQGFGKQFCPMWQRNRNCRLCSDLAYWKNRVVFSWGCGLIHSRLHSHF